MATNAFSTAIVPKSFQVTVGTTAARLKSSSTLAVRFSIIAPAVKIYIGDSSVASTRGIIVSANSEREFSEIKFRNENTREFDLANIWCRATAASSTFTVITWQEYKNS